MSAASVSLAIGTTAAANVTDGATTFMPPGVSVTIALQSSTGIKRWIVRADNPVGGSDPQGSLSAFQYQADTGGTFSTTLVLPFNATTIAFVSETVDAAGSNLTRAKFQISSYQGAAGGTQYHRAAVANTTNVNTAAMNVIIDSVTLVQGETVLLVNQTTAADNGLYTCGAVAANLCALTRSADLPAGAIVPSPTIVEIEKGTLYGGNSWKTTNTGSLTVGTTSLTIYPRIVRGTANLASNTVNVTSLWLATGVTGTASSTNIATTVQVAPTAGAGSGYVVLTGAAAGGVGIISYHLVNWG